MKCTSAGVDVGQFTQDHEYRHSIILTLARSGSCERLVWYEGSYLPRPSLLAMSYFPRPPLLAMSDLGPLLAIPQTSSVVVFPSGVRTCGYFPQLCRWHGDMARTSGRCMSPCLIPFLPRASTQIWLIVLSLAIRTSTLAPSTLYVVAQV